MADTPRMDAMVLEVTFDPSTGVLKLKDFEQKVEQTAKKSASSLDMLKKSFEGVGGVLGALGVGYSLQQFVGFLTTSVTEAANAERNVAKFTQAVRAAGGDVKATTDRATAFAQALSETTLYTDDAILSSQKLLYAIGGLRGEGLERATKAAADFASLLSGEGEQMSIEQAASLLAKAAAAGTGRSPSFPSAPADDGCARRGC